MIDVTANRASRKWTRKEQVGRMLWAVATPLWRFSPRPFWGWRRQLLRLFGAKVAAGVHIYPTVHITIPWNLHVDQQAAIGDYAILYSLGEIQIGARATISQYAHLCAGTHDWRDPSMPLIKSNIIVENDAWVCADAFVGPGAQIGAHAIVGARAVSMKSVAPYRIVAGNPAREIGSKPH